MKMMANLCTAAPLFVSSLGFALPKINTDVMTEVKNVDQMITDLQDYESRDWAIGLHGDTLQPDAFQRFFAGRDLDFKYFVRSKSGLSIGEKSAYQENRDVLKAYRSRIIQEELADVQRIIDEMMKAQNDQSSVGFTQEGVQPDQFVKFFGERALEIRYFVQGPEFNLGDVSAYEHNMKVLNEYAQKLRELGEKPSQN